MSREEFIAKITNLSLEDQVYFLRDYLTYITEHEDVAKGMNEIVNDMKPTEDMKYPSTIYLRTFNKAAKMLTMPRTEVKK